VCPVGTFARTDSSPPMNPAVDPPTLLGEDLIEEHFSEKKKKNNR